MSEDFLKKISSQGKQSESNPLSSLFKKKIEEVEAKEGQQAKPVLPPAGFDGIENLGNSPTSKERFNGDETVEEKSPPQSQAAETAPVKLEEKENLADKIPAKSLDNADIFSRGLQDDDGGFVIKTSSSFESLNLDDEKQDASLFSEKVIEEVVNKLKANKPDEAISIINNHKE